MQRNNEGLTAQQDFRNQYGVPMFYRPFSLSNRKRNGRLITAAVFTIIAGAAVLFGGELVYAALTGKLVIR